METKIIGGKIAEARKRMNFSQAQLAEHLFISPQAVGKWERGESLPDIVTCIRLAEVLGVDLNYFSQNFPSTAMEATAQSPVGPPAEPLPGKQKQKLSWDMSSGNWVDADFSGLKNLHEKFSTSNLQRCKFIGSELSGLLLKGNNIESCDFSGSDISSSHIQRSHVFKNIFVDCSLREAEFSGSHIQGCDFSGADLTGATFKSCSCVKITMANTMLNRTAFIGSDMMGIVFEGTLEDCAFENCAFSKVTFQNSTLINTFFKGGNLKKVRLIDCQADRLTYEFLKNGKAEMSGVTLLTP